MNKHRISLIVVLIAAGSILFLFFRFGYNDSNALTGFLDAYGKYDQAITDFSKVVFAAGTEAKLSIDELEHKTDQALAELITKSSTRISSLTKHDADIMRLTREIADLSLQELDALKAYKSALAYNTAGVEKSAQEVKDLTNKRQAAYAQFLALAK